MNNIKKPSFFIVGAPKSGTTSLDYHLNLHPNIFMGKKELHFFGTDLPLKQDHLTLEKYLQYFKQANKNDTIGESSVWYLYSKLAAQEIFNFNPNAKIIIILRNPSEMLPSLHSQFLYNGDETITNFEEALHFDIKRLKEKKKIEGKGFVNRPGFFESVDYYQMVKRYLDTFPKANVLILKYDDLQTNYLKTYHQTLNFLGLESFNPPIKKINSNKSIKIQALHNLDKHPPTVLKKLFRTVVPKKDLRHKIMLTIGKYNIKEKPRPALDSNIITFIKTKTKPSLIQLEKLINQDISNWYN